MSASLPGSFHVSNLLTYLSLLAGVGAIASAQRGSAAGAGLLIAAGVIADTFDGRFARSFTRDDTRRAFGGEIDSLSDAIAFGIAPVVTATLLVPGATWPLEMLWWLTGFAFAACAVTRLAYFNLHHDDGRGFIGVPVPVAALIWATALLFPPGRPATASLFAVCAALMVTPLRIPRPSGAGLALFVLWPVAVALAHAWRFRPGV